MKSRPFPFPVRVFLASALTLAAATTTFAAAACGAAQPANPALPTVWLIGDSTVCNGQDDGQNKGDAGQWGWGHPLADYFDPAKANLVNRAIGGTSSRTFYSGNWPGILASVKKGDFVIMQFGHNDNNGVFTGAGDETQAVTNRSVSPETVHTFDWYLRKFVAGTRAKGATPIICSLTPRKGWTADGHFGRSNTTHAAWAGQIAKETNTPYVDLYEQIARAYEALGKEKVDALYVPSPTEKLHTGWDGAVVNAECVVAGLHALKDNPLAAFESPHGQAVAAVDTTKPAPPLPAKPAAPAAK